MLYIKKHSVIFIVIIFQFQEFLELCLSSNDELLHSAIYNWMMNKKLNGELVTYGRPSLENFLQRSHTSKQFTSPEVKEILWMFLERRGNHAAAADILFQLAKETRSVVDDFGFRNFFSFPQALCNQC